MTSDTTNYSLSGLSHEWTIHKSVGAMVRSLREKKGISLRTFASMVGVSPTYVSFLERNIVKSQPTERLIKKMALVLEADEDEMLALAGKVSQEFIFYYSKNPRQVAALLKSAKNLPAEEIEALTARAIEIQSAIDAKEKTHPVGETKRKKK